MFMQVLSAASRYDGSGCATLIKSAYKKEFINILYIYIYIYIYIYKYLHIKRRIFDVFYDIYTFYRYRSQKILLMFLKEVSYAHQG